MPNSSQDFLAQAKLMQASASSEMEYRTATNRGYYSVYHNALQIKTHISLPDVNQLGGFHARLYGSLEGCRARHSTKELDVRRVGIMASRLLKPYRVNADYDIHLAFQPSIMNEVIAKAELLGNLTCEIIAGHKLGSTTPTLTKPSLQIVK